MQIVVVSEQERQWFEAFLPLEFRGSQTQTQLLYGAVDDQTGTAVGAMLLEAADDIVELQWICVADEWRRKGIARQMIDEWWRGRFLLYDIGTSLDATFDTQQCILLAKSGTSAMGDYRKHIHLVERIASTVKQVWNHIISDIAGYYRTDTKQYV